MKEKLPQIVTQLTELDKQIHHAWAQLNEDLKDPVKTAEPNVEEIDRSRKSRSSQSPNNSRSGKMSLKISSKPDLSGRSVDEKSSMREKRSRTDRHHSSSSDDKMRSDRRKAEGRYKRDRDEKRLGTERREHRDLRDKDRHKDRREKDERRDRDQDRDRRGDREVRDRNDRRSRSPRGRHARSKVEDQDSHS